MLRKLLCSEEPTYFLEGELVLSLLNEETHQRRATTRKSKKRKEVTSLCVWSYIFFIFFFLLSLPFSLFRNDCREGIQNLKAKRTTLGLMDEGFIGGSWLPSVTRPSANKRGKQTRSRHLPPLSLLDVMFPLFIFLDRLPYREREK